MPPAGQIVVEVILTVAYTSAHAAANRKTTRQQDGQTVAWVDETINRSGGQKALESGPGQSAFCQVAEDGEISNWLPGPLHAL
jgi:hypothetical protein